MKERITNYLNRPFPLFFKSLRGYIYFSYLLLIMAFGVNFYQPFGLANWNEYHKGLVLTAYCFVFSITYACTHLVYSIFYPDIYKPEHWTVGRELRIVLIYLFVLAITTQVFACIWIQEYEHSLASFFRLQLYNDVSVAGIVLVFGYIVSKKLKTNGSATEEAVIEQEQKQETALTPIATTPENFLIIIKNIHLDVNNILFAESKRNDLRIYHEYNGKVQLLVKILTLTEFEELVSGYSFMKRCHKSYVVNINYIVSWEGTLEKMTLHLKNCTHTVSVSESISPEFKEMMELRSIPKLK